MDHHHQINFDPADLPSPCFIVDTGLLQKNLSALKKVKDETGCHILLALKGFAMFSVFPILRSVLDGICASSPHEAILGREEFGGEVHAYAAAFSANDVAELIPLVDHLVFNSFSQWEQFKPMIESEGKSIQCGIRVNPEKSVGHVPIYDPCAAGSRLGVRPEDFRPDLLSGISGLHFHALCEQGADELAAVLAAFEVHFGDYLYQMDWVNLGGGHHITRPDYDLPQLCRMIRRLQETYGVTVYLEPGEAVALNTGFLVASVLDVVRGSDMNIAILDTSAACHMPDVLEMPYRPEIIGAGEPGEKANTYRLGGLSCLAGDIIGEYSFDAPLAIGDRLIFCDMAHYSMVKTNTFNGVKLPSIAVFHHDTHRISVVREFGYMDFKQRLS